MPQHCLICNMVFTHWNNRPYRTHVLAHVAAKLVDGSYFVNTKTALSYWYCKICGFKYSDRDKLHAHLMEQHKDMIGHCTTEWYRNKNESGEAFFIEEYADMGLNRLLRAFNLANPERPPDSELKQFTWGQFDFSRMDPCPICLEGMQLREPGFLENCKHRFHARCLKELVKSGATHCPVCRVKLHRNDGANYQYPDDPDFIL